ncbi:MAG: hypothetical protein LBB40_03795 [Holophagales bacterium]|nr:hypothetical protein [Holophagales bacterium]
MNGESRLKKIFVLAILLTLIRFAIPVSAQDKSVILPLPSNLKSALNAKTPEELLGFFFGITFRVDGTIDEHGNYTLFSRPDNLFKEPGLNCSGFILAASRLLFRKNIPLSVAGRDRLGDSGAGAILGQDWDFGWDLILNISEGLERTLLLPGGAVADPAAGNGLSPLGFDLHSPETWRELPSRIRPNHLYFVSFNRPTKQRGYSFLHYHVGILIRTSQNDWYIYHSIKKRGVVRENLGNERIRARFLNSNANAGNARKHMFITEVPLPLL